MQKTNRLSTIMTGVLVLSVGILIGLNMTAESPNSDPLNKSVIANSKLTDSPTTNLHTANTTPPTDEVYQKILQKFEIETNARKELEKSVLALKLQVSILGAGSQDIETTEQQTSAEQTTDTTQWFNEAAMADTGLSAAVITQLKSRYETMEMEKLYIRDRAIRENWIRTPRYIEELNALDEQFESFRTELDSNTYETLLFATGQSNRVVIQDVMNNSPADAAGIKPGDYILQYANEKIFSTSDLRTAITNGDAGEEIRVELSRSGNNMTVYIPRGPLGIRMESSSVKP